MFATSWYLNEEALWCINSFFISKAFSLLRFLICYQCLVRKMMDRWHRSIHYIAVSVPECSKDGAFFFTLGGLFEKPSLSADLNINSTIWVVFFKKGPPQFYVGGNRFLFEFDLPSPKKNYLKASAIIYIFRNWFIGHDLVLFYRESVPNQWVIRKP